MLVGSAGTARAQSPTLAQYVHARFDAHDGLPHSVANSLAQTPDGYLWVGTEEGLVRFDGTTFRVIDRHGPDGPPTNTFQVLLASSDGALWAGTRDRGLLRYSEGRFESIAPTELGGQVRALAVDHDGTMWVGTRDRGLARLRGTRVVERFHVGSGLPSEDVRAIAVTREGDVWIGTFGGTARLHGGTLELGPPELAELAVHSIVEDRRGDLWFATNRGLAHLHDHAIAWIPDTAPIETGRLLCDREGAIWLGTQDRVVRIGEDGALDRMVDGDVLALLEDTSGQVWIGTGNGLELFARGDARPYGMPEGISDRSVFGIGESADGAMWFATEDGVFRYFKSAATRLAFDRGVVFTVHVDGRGDVWVGTRDGSLGRWRDGAFAWLGRRNWEGVRTIVDGLDGVWLGTEHGVFALHGDDVDHAELVVPNVIVNALEPARDGTLWIGTQGTGVIHLGPAGALTVPPGGPSATSSVTSFWRDADDTLWLGTEGDGLWRLRGATWSVLTTRDGLFDDLVWRVLDDGHGRMWMSSNRGIWRVDRAALESRLRAGPPVRAVVYGEADGMRNRECNGNVGVAGWRARDGRLWFPTEKGAVAFDPAHLAPRTVPRTFVEGIAIDGVPAPVTEDVVVPPGSSRLVIRFTAPELVHPQSTRFRYMLAPFDSTWVEAGTQRDAQYTNLAPGRYTFVVEASLGEGFGPSARLALALAPRIYQTLWFRLLGAATTLALVLAVPLFRVRRLRLRAAELDARVEEATRELKVLRGLIPICAWCKKIRDDGGAWNKLEAYITSHTHATFTHGICPDCDRKMADEDE